MSRIIRQPLLVAGGLAVVVIGAVLLHQNDPTETGWFPKCTLHSVTGLHCPGCGMTRAVHELLHLRIGAALAFNPLLVSLLLVGMGLALLEGVALVLGDRYRGPRVRLPVWSMWVLLGAVLAFWVLRNIPAWPFTLLAPS